MKNTKPFLKWAGGKTRVAPMILPFLEGKTRLVEPFAGSCALFLQSDFKDALLCDFNPDLVRLYLILQAKGDEFIERVGKLFTEENNSLESFLCLRAEFNALRGEMNGLCGDGVNDALDSEAAHRRAALFVYLNRHAFNGMCRYNRSGDYNVPYGKYRKAYFPRKEMQDFHDRVKDTDKVEFRHASFTATMKRETENADTAARTVVYADPPYIEISQTASFTAYATDGFEKHLQDDLGRLAVRCRHHGIRTVISNHNVQPALRIYEYGEPITEGAETIGGHADYIISFDVRRSISAASASRKAVSELIAVYEPGYEQGRFHRPGHEIVFQRSFAEAA